MGLSEESQLLCGTRRDQVRLLGNGVCSPRDSVNSRHLKSQDKGSFGLPILAWRPDGRGPEKSRVGHASGWCRDHQGYHVLQLATAVALSCDQPFGDAMSTRGFCPDLPRGSLTS